MTMKPKTTCANLACRKKIDISKTYCDEHKYYYKKPSKAYNYGNVSFYKSRDWTKLSKYIRSIEPLCRLCLYKKATMVDHIVPIVYGGDKWDHDNLQALCNRCHGAKTRQDKVKYKDSKPLKKEEEFFLPF